MLPVLSRLALPHQHCTLARCWGGRVFRGFLCSRLPLPPHLCTLGEVVGRVSLPSTALVRVLPGLPILGLGSWEGVEPALGRMALMRGLVAHAVAPLSLLGQRSRRCGRGSSRLLICLVRSRCDRWRSMVMEAVAALLCLLAVWGVRLASQA